MEKQQGLSILVSGRNCEKDKIFIVIQEIINTLLGLISTRFYFMDVETIDKLKLKYNNIQVQQFNPQQHHIDYVFIVGGDGSILYASKHFSKQTPPIISFQSGTLGFMCQFQTSQVKDVINLLVKSIEQVNQGQQYPFAIKNVMRINCCMRKIKGDNQHQTVERVCLNEAYISRVICHLITLDIYVNDEFLTETSGDGLLISTPTGSTAYSLSAGGPIMQNGVNSILIVPVAPNSLSFRPICITSDKVIKVRLSKKSRAQANVYFDGQFTTPFTLEDELVIKKSEHDLIFLTPKGKLVIMPSWFQRLNHFLGWNQTFKTPQCAFKSLKQQAEKTSQQQVQNSAPKNIFKF